MNHWESLVERKIREAMEKGAFDNLAGKGRAVDTSENPFEDPQLRTAHRLLQNAGFAPAWIEERKDIDAELAVATTLLKRAWLIYRQAAPAANTAEASWELRLGTFREKVAELNKRIRYHNLQVPSAAFQRPQINVEQATERVVASR